MWWCHKCHLPPTISLSLCFAFSLPSLFLSLQTPLTSLFFFSSFFLISFSHTLYSLPLMAHGEASLFSRSALGGWASDWCGWLQIGVGGFRLAWVASDRHGVVGGRGGLGSRGVVGSHGWPWALLLVGVSGWLEFQRCFNRVSRSLEFQRCFNGVSEWME